MGQFWLLQKRDVGASSSRLPAHKPNLDILCRPRKASRQQEGSAGKAGEFTVVALCFLFASEFYSKNPTPPGAAQAT